MPITIEKPLPSAQSVVAGTTAIIDLNTGNLRYHGILLALTKGEATASAVSAIIDEIRIKIDGRVVRRLLGSQIDYIDNFNGAGYASFAYDGGTNLKQRFLYLNFAEPWLRTADGEDALAWGMADIGNFQIEIDIAAGATNLDFTGVAEVDYGEFSLGAIRKMAQQTIPATAAGKYNHASLPKNLPYSRIHCFTDKIDAVRVILNGEIVREYSKAELLAKQTQRGLNPTSTEFTIDFDGRQRVGNMLPVVGANQFELEFDLASGVAPFQVVYEQVGPANA